jgi:hypothetical protein
MCPNRIRVNIVVACYFIIPQETLHPFIEGAMPQIPIQFMENVHSAFHLTIITVKRT